MQMVLWLIQGRKQVRNKEEKCGERKWRDSSGGWGIIGYQQQDDQAFWNDDREK